MNDKLLTKEQAVALGYVDNNGYVNYTSKLGELRIHIDTEPNSENGWWNRQHFKTLGGLIRMIIGDNFGVKATIIKVK